MTLRLTDEETEILRQQAEHERRSMHEVVRLAILERAARTVHHRRVHDAARRVIEEDLEILDKLRDA